MKLLRYAIITAVAALATAVSTTSAQAGPPGCATCGDGDGGYGHGSHRITPPPPTSLFKGFSGNLFHKQKLPVYQAAPWYNYWPYDGHFLTPAPVNGPFYGPPLTGNFPVNPYFPGPGGAAGFGPIPGGPPPGMMAPPGVMAPPLPGGGR